MYMEKIETNDWSLIKELISNQIGLLLLDFVSQSEAYNMLGACGGSLYVIIFTQEFEILAICKGGSSYPAFYNMIEGKNYQRIIHSQS